MVDRLGVEPSWMDFQSSEYTDFLPVQSDCVRHNLTVLCEK